MKYLKCDDILYRLVYIPDIHLEVYQVNYIDRKFDVGYQQNFVMLTPIIGNLIGIWIETNVNLNKLIKIRKGFYNYKTKSIESYFLTTNLELAIKRLNILIKYQPKK